MRNDRMAIGSFSLVAMIAAATGEARAQAARAEPAEESAVAAVLRRAGVAPTRAAVEGRDPKARAEALDALERSYPLPRTVLDLENRLPPDPNRVMDQLGLVRRLGAPVTDLSGSIPTARQITDALAPR
jgi:hypothetical protein